MPVAVIVFEGGELPDESNIVIIPAWDSHNITALMCSHYSDWKANVHAPTLGGKTIPIQETLQPVAGLSNVMFSGVVDPEDGGNFIVTRIPTHRDLPEITDLVAMFRSINGDLELDDPDQVVEFTDTEYYSNQIQNIFDLHWPVANAMARAMLVQVQPKP